MHSNSHRVIDRVTDLVMVDVKAKNPNPLYKPRLRNDIGSESVV